MQTIATRFVRIEVRVAPDLVDRVVAEAVEAGATGGVERASPKPGTVALDLYAETGQAAAVRRAVTRILPASAQLLPDEIVDDVDWSVCWRDGLRALSITPALEVRPSFAPSKFRSGQVSLVIDPGQAFGTGGHASTQLALELLAELPTPARFGARLLDVGTGSGILALCGLLLGVASATAFDLDPLAAPAAGENARRNGLEGGLRLFTGSLDALGEASFDLVVANLLRREAEPLLPALAARTRPGGVALFSGLLEREGQGFSQKLAAEGLDVEAFRTRVDPGGDVWLGLLTRR